MTDFDSYRKKYSGAPQEDAFSSYRQKYGGGADFSGVEGGASTAKPPERRTLGGTIKAAAKAALLPATWPTTKTGSGVAREAIQGATFGWGDEGEAALTGALSPGTIKEHLARIRGERQTFKGEHPGLAMSAEVLGGLGTGVPGASALLKGAKTGFQAAKGLAKVGAIGGGLGGSGAAEGGIPERLVGGAIGAGAGAVLGGATGAAPKLASLAGRSVGLATAKGSEEAIDKLIREVIERSGQSVDEVMAKPGTLLEAMGPQAARTLLGRLASLGPEAAAAANQQAAQLGKGPVSSALERLANKQAPKPGLGTGVKLAIPGLGGFAVGGPVGAAVGAAAGMARRTLVQRLASKEADQTISRLLASRAPKAGKVVGNIGPEQTIAEALAERQAAKADLTTNAPRVGPEPEIPASGYEPNANPVRESEAFIARKLKYQGIRTPSHRDPIVGPKVPEPSDAELEALIAQARSQPDNLEAQQLAEELGAMLKGRGGDDMETLLQGSLQKKKGPISSLLENKRGALGVESAKPPELPERISNPTDPYAEITQSAGPETPELARVKLLRKTLGMKGKLDPSVIAMLLASGAASGGALTAALALRRRGKQTPEHANKR